MIERVGGIAIRGKPVEHFGEDPVVALGPLRILESHRMERELAALDVRREQLLDRASAQDELVGRRVERANALLGPHVIHHVNAATDRKPGRVGRYVVVPPRELEGCGCTRGSVPVVGQRDEGLRG